MRGERERASEREREGEKLPESVFKEVVLDLEP